MKKIWKAEKRTFEKFLLNFVNFKKNVIEIYKNNNCFRNNYEIMQKIWRNVNKILRIFVRNLEKFKN